MAKRPTKKATAKKQVKRSAPPTGKKKATAKKKSVPARKPSSVTKAKVAAKKRISRDAGVTDVLKHVFFRDDGA